MNQEKEKNQQKKSSLIKDIFDLYFTFFKIGSVTFGGGYAMLPILERTLVDKKHWTTNDALLDYYAISQATPGVIAVNVSTFVGFYRRGILGGIFATLGVITPSIIVITLIAEFISNFEDIIWVQKALLGINVAVAALLTYSVFNITKKNLKRWWNIFFYAASFVSVYFFKVHSVFVILASVLVGILLYFVQRKNDGKAACSAENLAGNTANFAVNTENSAVSTANSVSNAENSACNTGNFAGNTKNFVSNAGNSAGSTANSSISTKNHAENPEGKK